jgi:hypothetical protein
MISTHKEPTMPQKQVKHDSRGCIFITAAGAPCVNP